MPSSTILELVSRESDSEDSRLSNGGKDLVDEVGLCGLLLLRTQHCKLNGITANMKARTIDNTPRQAARCVSKSLFILLEDKFRFV